MKTLRNLLTAVVILCGTLTMNAQSMSITAIRSNARFLTDRMAYTLGIRDPFLIDEIYRINYDYICGVNYYLDDIALGYYYDDYMAVCDARDIALRNLLGITVWNRLLGYSYFHRPIIFANHRWHFGIYDHDRYGASYYHYAAPRPFGNGYAGGHFFGGMTPRGGRGNAAPQPPRGDNGRGNNTQIPPKGDVNNGRGNNTQTPPKGDVNNGRGNNTQTPPKGDVNNGRGGNNTHQGNNPSVGNNRSNRDPSVGRSHNNLQSSSRVTSPGVSQTRSNTNTGRGAGATRTTPGGSRGGGRR